MDYLVRINLSTGGRQSIHTKGMDPAELLETWQTAGYIQTSEPGAETLVYIPWNAVIAVEMDLERSTEMAEKRD